MVVLSLSFSSQRVLSLAASLLLANLLWEAPHILRQRPWDTACCSEARYLLCLC